MANRLKYKSLEAMADEILTVEGVEVIEEDSEVDLEEVTEIEEIMVSEIETIEDQDEISMIEVTDQRDVSTVRKRVIWLETVLNVNEFLIISEKTKIICSQRQSRGTR